MSFSGLKTAMLNLIHNAQQKGEELPVADLAASFSAAVSEELVPRTMAAAQAKGYGKVAVVGGVSAGIWSRPARLRAVPCISRR